MAPIDAMFWALEKDRRLRTTTVAISVLDRAPDRPALRSILRRACERIPRLRQRVVEVPLGVSTPVWRDDPEFRLDDHLRFTTAPLDGRWPFVLQVAADMAARAFDRSRPLWEFLVVEGLEGGRAALVQKLHHSVGDGAAGVALMAELYHATRNPPLPFVEDRSNRAGGGTTEVETAYDLLGRTIREQVAGAPGSLRAGLRYALAAARSPVESAEVLLDEARAVAGIMRSGPGPLSSIWRERSSRSVFATVSLPQEQLAAAAREVGGTFNDAFLTALAVGLRRYHESRGKPVAALRAAIPISVRDESGALSVGNRLSIGRFDLPCEEKPVGDVMRDVHERVRAQRAPASLAAFETLATLVNLSPIELILPLILEEMVKSDVVATAVPGPPETLYLAGSQVESLYAFGPTAGAALNVTLTSHLDEASVAFTIDAAAIPDVSDLIACIKAGFADVLAVAPGSGPALQLVR